MASAEATESIAPARNIRNPAERVNDELEDGFPMGATRLAARPYKTRRFSNTTLLEWMKKPAENAKGAAKWVAPISNPSSNPVLPPRRSEVLSCRGNTVARRAPLLIKQSPVSHVSANITRGATV